MRPQRFLAAICLSAAFVAGCGGETDVADTNPSEAEVQAAPQDADRTFTKTNGKYKFQDVDGFRAAFTDLTGLECDTLDPPGAEDDVESFSCQKGEDVDQLVFVRGTNTGQVRNYLDVVAGLQSAQAGGEESPFVAAYEAGWVWAVASDSRSRLGDVMESFEGTASDLYEVPVG